jgi:sec-independent protein translocase protein TatA
MEAFVILAVGVWQIVLIVAVALLLFGGKKIPELMRGIGQGMKEFKKATSEDNDVVVDDTKDPKKIKGGKE